MYVVGEQCCQWVEVYCVYCNVVKLQVELGLGGEKLDEFCCIGLFVFDEGMQVFFVGVEGVMVVVFGVGEFFGQYVGFGDCQVGVFVVEQ